MTKSYLMLESSKERGSLVRRSFTPLGRRLVLLAFLLFFTLAIPSSAVAGTTGSTPLAIVLCKFGDQPTVPAALTQDYLSRQFTVAGSGRGGVGDYWRRVSLSQIDESWNRLFGGASWYQLLASRTRVNCGQNKRRKDL
jgi:hypothetical protein